MGQSYSVPRARWSQLEDMCEIDSRRGPLGTGAFGVVWRGREKKAGGNIVALKVQDKSKMDALGIPLEVVESEAALMRECDGRQWFVQLIDFFQDSTAYCLVLEYCDCGTLASAVKDGTALGDGQVSLYMSQLLQGIAFLHGKNICHRDVKPQNAMLASTWNPSKNIVEAAVKLGDFGLAKHFDVGALMKDKVGTPAFMAPELHLLPKWSVGYDHAVDLWAAGCVMVFLLASEYAFIDPDGRVALEELLRGDLPIWNRTAFGGLFDPGASAKKPSLFARDLVRQLLAPMPQYRLAGGAALKHEWFRQPASGVSQRVGEASPVGGGAPLLLWEDFRTVPGVQDYKPARLVVDKMGIVVDKMGMALSPGSPMNAMNAHPGSPMSGSPNLLQALFYNGL